MSYEFWESLAYWFWFIILILIPLYLLISAGDILLIAYFRKKNKKKD